MSVEAANLLRRVTFGWEGIIAKQGKGSDLPIVPGVIGNLSSGSEFRYDSDTAVLPEYLEKAEEIVRNLPKNRYDLEKAARGDIINPLTPDEIRVRRDHAVDIYVSSYMRGKDKDENVPHPNPFNLYTPRGLDNIDAWLSEKGLKYEYRSRSNREQDKQVGKIDVYAYKSSQHEDNFIKVVYAWNVFHVEFLLSLNIADRDERMAKFQELEKEVFEKKMGFAQGPSLKELSPFDNATQWLVFNALNVLQSPEQAITPVARYRAIECLASLDTAELETAFFGNKNRVSERGGRNNPSDNYKIRFENELLRLPRRFWTGEEKAGDIHQNWEENPYIQEIFGTKGKRVRERSYDYGSIFNTLVLKYPREALHITLMMLLGSYKHQSSAFEALISFTKLDPVSRQRIFGRGATYLRLHDLAGGMQGKIEDDLGIAPFDDDTLASLEGLSPEDVRQVAHRYARQNQLLEEQLAAANKRLAEAYFASQSAKIETIDPKGYWRILGIHPETKPEDLEEVLRAAYRVLARKYHPDVSQKPDVELMKQINEAYEVLSDPIKRAAYTKK